MIGREAVRACRRPRSRSGRRAPRAGCARRRARGPFESTPFALRSALVVDPDDAQRRAVADCLIRHDFTVHEATNAEAALRLAVARRPWLIITEAQLADASGLEFCELDPLAQPAVPHAARVPLRERRLREPAPGAQGRRRRLPGEARALARAAGPARAGAEALRRRGRRRARSPAAGCAARSS